MRKLLWDVSFRIGFESIDIQHKKMFEISNEILTNQDEKKEEQIIVSVLKKLDEYMHFHFTDEESIMKKYGYPILPDHQIKHTEIRTSIQSVIAKSSGTPLLKQNLEELLLAWVKNHILIEDMRFSEWAKANKLI